MIAATTIWLLLALNLMCQSGQVLLEGESFVNLKYYLLLALVSNVLTTTLSADYNHKRKS